MVREAIQGSGGIISIIAKRCNVTREWMSKYLHKHKTLLKALKEEKESVLDMAEAKIISSLNNGDIKTVKWYLLTQGKDRGYSKREEIRADVRTVTADKFREAFEQYKKRNREDD